MVPGTCWTISSKPTLKNKCMWDMHPTLLTENSYKLFNRGIWVNPWSRLHCSSSELHPTRFLLQDRQGCQRVRITPSDLPKSPVEKNRRIWIYWSVYFQIPIATDLDLTSQFTGDPPVCLCQHYIDCISGTTDFRVPITACRSPPFTLLPIIPVCLLPASTSICLCHRPLALNLISCEHLPSDISHKYYYYYENEIFYLC